MDKGWGLTLDSESAGFFLGKQLEAAAKRTTSMFPGNNRVFDFLSDNKRPLGDDLAVSVKKENNPADPDERSLPSNLDVNTGLALVIANAGSDESTLDDGVSSDSEEKLSKIELAKMQVMLQHMNAENRKLREMLTQVSNNYNALHTQFVAVTSQQKIPNIAETGQELAIVEERAQERQFLDLGRPGSVTDDVPVASNNASSSSEDRTRSATPQNKDVAQLDHHDNKRIGREDSPESEWGPNKAPKLSSPGNKPIEQSADATMRKARVSVRARSEAPMINDGCQWRKYGQKMAKGNPCPRAYYRCTMAVGCPVRKQVQRCADDRTILITTYEGNHNHPLPPTAMAMASTTQAAANMLLSGSMSSADGLMNPNLLARAILPGSSTSMATISASAPFPTVTLDLTNNPNPLQFNRPSPPHFQIPFAGAHPSQQQPQAFGQALYNQSKFSGLQLSQHDPMTGIAPSHIDSVSAATAAITANPNFTAALAAAISSIMGGAQQNGGGSSNNVNKNNNFPGN